MSLINQVLKDLKKRHRNSTPLPLIAAKMSDNNRKVVIRNYILGFGSALLLILVIVTCYQIISAHPIEKKNTSHHLSYANSATQFIG
jgi:hypothetical protein